MAEHLASNTGEPKVQPSTKNREKREMEKRDDITQIWKQEGVFRTKCALVSFLWSNTLTKSNQGRKGFGQLTYQVTVCY